MSNDLPLLAITLGDPAGIGPEVVLKTLQHADVYARCRPLVLGDRRILERAAPWVGATDLAYELVEDPASGHYRAGTVTLLDMANAAPDACPVGQVGVAAGRAAVEACSATRKSARSGRRSRRRAQAAGRSPTRSRPTRCSCALPKAPTTLWWPCTTIRVTSQ